jgi:hypothetical protein
MVSLAATTAHYTLLDAVEDYQCTAVCSVSYVGAVSLQVA